MHILLGAYFHKSIGKLSQTKHRWCRSPQSVMAPSLNEPADGHSTPPAQNSSNKAISKLQLQGLPPQLVAWRILGRDSEPEKSDQAMTSYCLLGETKVNLNCSSVWRAWDSCMVWSKKYIPFCQVYLFNDLDLGRFRSKYHSLNCYWSVLSSALLVFRLVSIH